MTIISWLSQKIDVDRACDGFSKSVFGEWTTIVERRGMEEWRERKSAIEM